MVCFMVYDFLYLINCDISGCVYICMGEMLVWFIGICIEINIEMVGKCECGFFGLIDFVKVIEWDGGDCMVVVEVILLDWLFCSVDVM